MLSEPIVNFASYYKLAGWASIFGMYLKGKVKDEGIASNINKDSVVNILKNLVFFILLSFIRDQHEVTHI